METGRHEGIVVERCREGCGEWLDRDELRQAIARRDEDHDHDAEHLALEASGNVASQERSEKVACPRCRQQMTRRAFAVSSGVEIDECHLHGVWLDAGELQRIEAWSEGLERVKREDRAELSTNIATLQRSVRESSDSGGSPFRRLTRAIAEALPG